MTTPEPAWEPYGAAPDPELEPMAAQFAAMDAAALEYELEAEESVVGQWLLAVATANAVIVSAYAALAAPVAGGVLTGRVLGVLQDLIRRRYGALTPSMGRPLELAVLDGIQLGYDMSDGDGSGLEVDDPELDAAVESIDTDAQAVIDAAVELADAWDAADEQAVNDLTIQAYRSVTRAEAATRWSANRALARGVEQAAKEGGDRVVWVPERNACLHCLAYAGLAVEPGELFPPGLTMGDTPLKVYPANAAGVVCPLHPNCRCRLQRYDGPDRTADISSLDVASVLWREARRSVIRGLTDYASEPARLRAAERLIRAGASLPKTVVERGRRDVKRKSFTQRPV